MTTVFLTSPETNAGKTMLAIALGQRLGRMGKRVGYRRLPGPGASEDAAFAGTALQQREPAEVIGPPPERIGESLKSDADVLLVEAGDAAVAATVAQVEGVIPLVVARFGVDNLAETIIAHVRSIGVPRANVVINVVPDKGLRQVRQRVLPALQEAGLTVVGVLPQDRILLGTTVGELSAALGAEVLCAHDQLSLPVEAVMIAAMSDEGAEEYFRRVSRKAVVAAGDRPDIHMPALATDTSCIVLSQGLDPDPTVFKTADQQGIPLLKVKPDTMTTLDEIADHFYQVRFRQRHKIGPAVGLSRAYLDEGTLFAALGIDRREVA
jgi:BioD-like phosphotransacetylase family protein